jgi:hypothetical protein
LSKRELLRRRIRDIREARSYGKKAREEAQRRARVVNALTHLERWRRAGTGRPNFSDATPEERDAIDVMEQMARHPLAREYAMQQRERRKNLSMGGGV